MSDAEFLDVGEPRRRPSRARRLVLVSVAVVIVVVAAAALVVDRGLRIREERAVAGCAEEVADAVGFAGSRVRAAYEYVRPSLSDPTPELEAGMRRFMASAAEGAADPLAATRTRCADVEVLPFHDDLQARRDRCVAVVETQRVGLATVADDGTGVVELLSAPRAC